MGWWDSITSGISNYFSDGDGWGDLLGGLLSGLGGSAAARREDDRAEQNNEWAIALQALRGEQDLNLTAFEKELEDYYKQRDKYNKRVALDTYGQFSVNHRRMPGYTPAPAPVAPAKPSVENYRTGGPNGG